MHMQWGSFNETGLHISWFSCDLFGPARQTKTEPVYARFVKTSSALSDYWPLMSRIYLRKQNILAIATILTLELYRLLKSFFMGSVNSK